MAAQTWQQTNANFSDVNSAMATASASFGKAGALAKGLVDSINKTSDAKQKELQTAYLLDTTKRNQLVEQAQYDLGADRNKVNAQEASDIFNNEKNVGQTNLRTEVNNQLKAQRVYSDGQGYTDVQGDVYTEAVSGPDGNPLLDPTTQQPVMKSYKMRGGLVNKYDTLPEGLSQQFERKGFVDRAYKALMATGKYSNPATALAAANAEANRQLGALPSAAILKSKQKVLTEVFKGNVKMMEAYLKNSGKSPTNITVNGTSGRTNANGSYTTFSDKNNPEINAEWLNTFDDTRGPLDAGAAALSSDTAINQNVIRNNQLEYINTYNVTPAQYRAFMNGAIKEGMIGDAQAPDTIFTGTKEQKQAIANAMKKFGHDSQSTKVRGGGGVNTAAALKAKYKTYEAAFKKANINSKSFLSDVQNLYASATGKSKKQIVSAFLASKVQSSNKALTVTNKEKEKEEAQKPQTKPLFTGSDSISRAMSTTSKVGESDLADLQVNKPTAYLAAVKKLSPAEKLKVKSYTNSKAYKTMLAKYVKSSSTSKDVNKEEEPVVTANQPQGNVQTSRGGGHGAGRKYTAPKKTVYAPKKAKAKLPLAEIQKYYKMSDEGISGIGTATRIKLLQDYSNLPTQLRRKLSHGLY